MVFGGRGQLRGGSSRVLVDEEVDFGQVIEERGDNLGFKIGVQNWGEKMAGGQRS